MADVESRTVITIDDTQVGQMVADLAVLNSVVLLTPSTDYRSYLTLNDDFHVQNIIHIDPSTSHIGPGTSLLTDGGIPVKNLTFVSIPPGSTWQLDLQLPPTLTSLNPATAVSGDPDFVLSCIGTDLTENTVIEFANQMEPTTLVSETEVTTIVKPSLFAPATVPVRLSLGEYFTDPLDFTFSAPRQVPNLGGVSPTSASITNAPFQLLCIGTSFTNNAVIIFEGEVMPTTFVSANQLTTTIDPSLYTEGVASVIVRDGELSSTSRPFTFTASLEESPEEEGKE